MKLPRPYSLQSKFLIGLIMTSVAIGGLLLAGFSYHMRQVLEREVEEKAAMVLAQVDAVQQYVRRILRPRMYEVLDDTFIIEAMSSSFITRNIMDGVSEHSPTSHLYRRVAIGARNPKFEANQMERDLVDYFRARPDRKVWQGYTDIDGVEHFVMARPVIYAQSCLHCHGRPEDAPEQIMALYGDRGFGHRKDSIGGVDFVGLPVSASVAHMQDTIMSYLMVFAIAALIYLGATNVIFKRIVANNIRLLTTCFKRNFSDDKGLELVRKLEKGDEIGQMISGIEQLGDYLYETREQLQHYANDLEGMVRERTEKLAEQAEARSADVRLFVRLLAGSSRSGSRPELWESTLPHIVARFDLERAVYVCTFYSRRHYSWPQSDVPPELPENWIQLLTESRPHIEADRAFIPVESSVGNAEGLLCLYRKPGHTFVEQDEEVFQALGRQLGIAADNIMALDSIVRNNANMHAIFEGITEPLLLVDASANPVVVNEAARRLGLDLSGGTVRDGSIIALLCERADTQGDCDISKSLNLNEVISREVSLPSGRSFALSIYPVAESGGARTQAAVYVHETTQQKRMLAHMTQAEKLATVGKLASGLAHEINNPLGVILCYAKLLKKGLPEGQSGEDVDVIVKHTRQAQNVLKNLLSFARPKAGNDQAVDLPAIIDSLVAVFRVQAESQHAVLAAEIDGDIPPVPVDIQALEHIMANLIINALDAIPDRGGRIDIRTSFDARTREVVVTVGDNGPGIAEEDRHFIFDPFYTTKEVNKGSGLGLSIVFGFMSDLGGSVVADNLTTGGARFTLRFPVTRTENK
ncbi:DUF3365 domain-containing protein [Desulfovibrio sp. Huiquan2017]|uniref:c-type heme family protein n=1 Tax=Desulfovibrio sp. Huiquan2017 TaxID=2816861 RepID=UPI001A9389A2|nr:DUF3365 domain-containing protein [Desulfovibrio sp. Huiquan2017]